jgi:hypothetical protein
VIVPATSATKANSHLCSNEVEPITPQVINQI